MVPIYLDATVPRRPGHRRRHQGKQWLKIGFLNARYDAWRRPAEGRLYAFLRMFSGKFAPDGLRGVDGGD